MRAALDAVCTTCMRESLGRDSLSIPKSLCGDLAAGPSRECCALAGVGACACVLVAWRHEHMSTWWGCMIALSV
eukprot:5921867-Prymnesium_polylepis.2